MQKIGPIKMSSYDLVNNRDYQKKLKWKIFSALRDNKIKAKVKYDTILFKYKGKYLQIDAKTYRSYGGTTFALWQREYIGRNRVQKTLITDYILLGIEDGELITNEKIMDCIKRNMRYVK